MFFVLRFLSFMFHIFFTLLFRDDEKTKVLRNLQRYLPSHMAKEAVTKV